MIFNQHILTIKRHRHYKENFTKYNKKYLEILILIWLSCLYADVHVAFVIEGHGNLAMSWTCGLWTVGDIYCASPATWMTQNLTFWGLTLRTSPSKSQFTTSQGYWRPIITQVLTWQFILIVPYKYEDSKTTKLQFQIRINFLLLTCMSGCHLRYRSDVYTIWDDCSNRLNENIAIDAKMNCPWLTSASWRETLLDCWPYLREGT